MSELSTRPDNDPDYEGPSQAFLAALGEKPIAAILLAEKYQPGDFTD